MKLQTRLRSTFMRVVGSAAFQRSLHVRARLRRRLQGEPPVVHYFHEVADPYSQLAVQRLDALREKYSVAFEVHLTAPAAADYRGDAGRYPDWARMDAASIAPGYGVGFPADPVQPSQPSIETAASRLAAVVKDDSFAASAIELGDALWRGRGSEAGGDVSALEAGNRLRSAMGHYAGAMFWFDGEWYWGLDRLELLERRLIEEGYGSGEPLVPLPAFQAPAGAGALTLEVFPSLRSPYTAMSFDRAMALVDRTGINLVLRPVMPMMMRGVPAPRKKGTYIMFDAAREARRYGVPFGNFVDPFGPPVIMGFSLFPFAERQGRGRAYISRYLRAAWVEGIDITNEQGLKTVIEDIGLSWRDARERLGSDDATAMLEENVGEMLGAGLWGVPSFRVSGGNAPAFSCWGQDRLWRVEQEIANRMEAL